MENAHFSRDENLHNEPLGVANLRREEMPKLEHPSDYNH